LLLVHADALLCLADSFNGYFTKIHE